MGLQFALCDMHGTPGIRLTHSAIQVAVLSLPKHNGQTLTSLSPSCVFAKPIFISRAKLVAQIRSLPGLLPGLEDL